MTWGPRWARSTAVVSFIAALVLVATRWPLAPRYLYYFDAVNFALALEDFNPQLHQPQPPGYPLFVGVTRLLHLFIPSPEQSLLAAGLLGAFAAVLLMLRLGSEVFSRRAGILAAVLLAFNPAFWFGGLTNPVRVYLSVCSLTVAFLSWRALRHPQSPTWLYLAFGMLGLIAGFRPAVGLVISPLLLWVWFQTGSKLSRLLIGAAATAAFAVPWLVAVSSASGGFQSWLNLMWQYSNDQFSGSSAAFGASGQAASYMAKKAFIWNGTAAIAWIWVLPLLRRRTREAASGETWAFLGSWFLPGFAFSALIHIGDPDQALATIPVLCITGGALLDAWLRFTGNRHVLVAASAIVVVNSMLFFLPKRGITGASAYPAVLARDRDNAGVFDAIRQLRSDGPVTIVQYDSVITWRQISYYFPDDYVLYAPAVEGQNSYLLHGRKTVSTHTSTIPVQNFPRVALVTNGLSRSELVAGGWTPTNHSAVYWRTIQPGDGINVGFHQLLRANETSVKLDSTSQSTIQ